ncbi:MAG: hypothetical protein IMW97_03130 [Firmicutes bacterium]|nr:hypothetical protein [Candidatus Fermentithermobacillaceae bacterium]
MTGARDLPGTVAMGSMECDAGPGVRSSPGGSYIEVWVSAGRIDVFERQGDGKTARLVEALKKLGLEMRARTVSFCG